MICRLNDPQKFHILQIYLFLSTGTIPWAATVNSACRASQGCGFFLQKEGDNNLFLVLRVSLKGWGQSAKLGKHSAIWGKLGTALQAYALNPCTKFPPNPTSRKVNT